MLFAFALLIFFSALLLPGQAIAFDPSQATDPRVLPPTAYGLNIVRPEHRQSVDDHLHEVPASKSTNADHYAAKIDSIEPRDGPYANQLAEALMELGVAYRDSGHSQRAIDVFKRATHVLRINHGLDTPLQIPLLSQLIDGHLALGNYKKADEKQSVLYNLKQRIYQEEDPLRHIASDHFADWQRSAYLAQLGKKQYLRLLEFHKLHANRTKIQASLHGKNDPALVPLLYKQMHAEYLISLYDGEKEEGLRIKNSPPSDGAAATRVRSQAESQFYVMRKYNFRNGKKTIKRILDIYQHNPDTSPDDIAAAKIALGDWNIWFGRPGAARNRYEEAFALLAASEDSERLIAESFGKPLELPTSSVFQPGRVARRKKHHGEVLMRFTVSKYGKAKQIKAIATDPALKEIGAGRRTYKLLKTIRFRPRMEAGTVVSTEGLERKYYVSF